MGLGWAVGWDAGRFGGASERAMSCVEDGKLRRGAPEVITVCGRKFSLRWIGARSTPSRQCNHSPQIARRPISVPKRMPPHRTSTSTSRPKPRPWSFAQKHDSIFSALPRAKLLGSRFRIFSPLLARVHPPFPLTRPHSCKTLPRFSTSRRTRFATAPFSLPVMYQGVQESGPIPVPFCPDPGSRTWFHTTHSSAISRPASSRIRGLMSSRFQPSSLVFLSFRSSALVGKQSSLFSPSSFFGPPHPLLFAVDQDTAGPGIHLHIVVERRPQKFHWKQASSS